MEKFDYWEMGGYGKGGTDSIFCTSGKLLLWFCGKVFRTGTVFYSAYVSVSLLTGKAQKDGDPLFTKRGKTSLGQSFAQFLRIP